MTRRALIGLSSGLAICVALISAFFVLVMLTGETWCQDRSPWWGPPEDPASTCSGHAWAEKHPDEYPWTMPR